LENNTKLQFSLLNEQRPLKASSTNEQKQLLILWSCEKEEREFTVFVHGCAPCFIVLSLAQSSKMKHSYVK